MMTDPEDRTKLKKKVFFLNFDLFYEVLDKQAIAY